MYTKELFGKEVLDMSANKVGKVADLDFDWQQGVVNRVVIKAGLTRKYTITLDQIDRIGDKVILKILEDELAKKA